MRWFWLLLSSVMIGFIFVRNLSSGPSWFWADWISLVLIIGGVILMWVSALRRHQ